MKKGKCTKCDSEKIVKIPGTIGAYGSGNNITLGWTTLSSVKVTRFMCGICGFSEEWIENKSDINKIVEKLSN